MKMEHIEVTVGNAKKETYGLQTTKATTMVSQKNSAIRNRTGKLSYDLLASWPQLFKRFAFQMLVLFLLASSLQVAQAQCSTTWTSRTSAIDNDWRSVTYGNGLFVAVGASGTGNRVMTSPDGITWTSRSSAVDNAWYSVTYGNGLFVTVAGTGTGNRVMTSPDGINWTSRTSAADNSWLGVTFGNGLFVAVAWDGTNRVMTSPDGINWTSRTSAAANGWTAITYGNGVFVAVANTGTGNRVMTSPDGITWTSSTTAVNNNWCGVTYGNGVFVAVAPTGTGNRVMTSPDGITWTIRSSAADNGWTSVTYGNGLFVAVSLTGTDNRVMTSPDGITWTSRTSAADNGWTSVGYGNNLFVAVSLNGTGNRVMTSAPFNKTTAASTTPTLCVNSALTNITHTTTGATGIGTATGLPAGVSAAWASNTITISGTPTAIGAFNYSIPLTGGCGSVNATGTITVSPNITVTTASSTPTLCINTPLTNITHTTTVATGIGTPTGLPAGVSAAWASNTITISGTPTASGTFNYTIPLTGGCATVNATGTITVSNNAVAGVISGDGTVCIGNLTNIAIGKPATQSTEGWGGVPSRAVDGNTNTNWHGLSVSHTNGYNYDWWQVDLTSINAIHSIKVWNRTDVNSDLLTYFYIMTSSLPFDSTTLWTSQNLQTTLDDPNVSSTYVATPPRPSQEYPINKNARYVRIQRNGNCFYGCWLTLAEVEVFSKVKTLSVTGAVGAIQWEKSTDNINWTPIAQANASSYNAPTDVAGTFYYHTVVTNGACSATSPSAILTVINTVGAASSTPTLCINSPLTNITHTTTSATGIGTAVGLPAGVTATWANNVITISGTPTASGIFNYTIPLTGGCGAVNATGTITVRTPAAAMFSSPDTTICAGTTANLTVAIYGGVAPYTVVYSGGTVSNYTSGSNIPVSPSVTTNYSLTSVTDANGCKAQLDWKKIEAGESHTVGIKFDGSLWAWGSNAYGQLGDGTYTQRNSPVKIGTSTDWATIATGADHTLAIKTNGTLWAWGINNYTLGDGTTFVNRNSPVQIGNLTNWSSISAGKSHSVAIKTDGTLWAWGGAAYSQVGDGSGQPQSSPVKIGTATNWSSISANGSHTLALKQDGTIWTWGHNNTSQLGDGTTANSAIPKQIGTATNWSKIAACFNHSLAIKNDGTLWGWGYNGDGELGDGTLVTSTTPKQIGTAADWASIYSGGFFSIATKTDGTLWTWGQNTSGQLGDGTTAYKANPTQVGTSSDWSLIAGGNYHMLAAKSDGLWAWGYNASGSLGDGTTDNKSSPVRILANTFIDVTSAGAASSTPTLCNNTVLTNITHSTTGATGIGTATGLPAGVSAAWASNTITISGTPIASGTFNYSIPLTSGCGVVNAIGTITVTPSKSVTTASTTPTLCVNTPLTNITHNTTDATGIGTATGLPAGVTAAWATNTITISGTPTSAGTFNYSIPLIGGCGTVNATGTITVNASPASPTNANNGFVCGSGSTTISATPASNCTIDWYGFTPSINYSNDFNSAALNGASISGNASVISNGLVLTQNLYAQFGGFTIPSSGVNANKYNISFKMTNGGGGGADGMSYSFADDASATATTPIAENGTGTKLAICFDDWTCCGNTTGVPGIRVLYNSNSSTELSSTVGVQGVLGYSSNTTWIGMSNVPVVATISETGLLNLTVNGQAIFTNLQLPAGYLSADKSSWKHVFKARTGGSFMLHAIDDISILGYPFNLLASGSSTFTTPSIASTTSYYAVSRNLTSGCVSNTNLSVLTTVNPLPTLSASSGGASAVCVNATTPAFNNAQSGGTWSIVPGTGTASVSLGGAVTGLTAGTVSVVYTYNNGTCSNSVSSSVTVNLNTAGAASSTPTLCINTALTNITHTTTGATGIATATGLPAGVTAAWAANTITISGTPTASGTFNYSIPLTGGCGTVNAIGSITVTPNMTAGAASSTPTLVINTSLTNITHSTTGATGIGAATGLPTGVTATWASNTITIIGTPTAVGTFSYTIPLTGGCGTTNATGTIKVTGPVLYSNTFDAITSCTAQVNTPIMATGATGTALTRSTVTCNAGSSIFISTTLNVTSSVNNSSYIEFSASTSGNKKLNITGLYFFRQASSAAPNQLEVRYSTDGFATSTSWAAAPNSPISGSGITWDFTDFTTAVNGTVTFRLYPYGTQRADGAITAVSAAGTFRVDDVTIYGNVVYGPTAATIATMGPSVVCSGTSSAITAAINGGTAPYTVVYSDGTSNTTVTNYQSGTAIIVTPTATKNYTLVSVTDANAILLNTNLTGTATVTVLTVSTASSTPTLCINTPLININHSTEGAIGIGTATGLPAGVTAAWANNTITISGTPTEAGTFTYSIPLTGGCGAVSATGTITVNDMPSPPTITGHFDFCAGSTTTLSAGTENPNTYLWSNGETTSSIAATTAGDYSVTVTNAAGCSAASAVTAVTVNALPVIPTITASGSTTLCQGGNVTLSGLALPLNIVNGATLAIGLRKLKSTYTGPALHLRRSSDNQEQDFGFVGDDLDTAAISIWLDGAEGFCTTVYDQSGNGGHVTQSDLDAQPIYVAAGINNKPVLHFTTNQFMDNSVNYPAPFSAIYGARVTGMSSRLLSSKYNNWLLGYWNGSMDTAFFEGFLNNAIGTQADNSYTIYAGTGNGNVSTLYKNGTQLYSDNGGVEGPNGIRLNGSGQWGELSDGDFTDVMVFGTELSSEDIAKLNTSISGYYSTNNASNGALSYAWSNGATTQSIEVSTAGDYSVTITNASGCSATSETTSVTVNHPTTETTVATSCGMYIWDAGNYSDYFESGTYSYTENCVTHILELTVNQPTIWYADLDSDGFGDATVTQLACSQPANYVTNNTDCDDTNSAVSTGTVITSQPVNPTICKLTNATATVTVNALTATNATYQWYAQTAASTTVWTALTNNANYAGATGPILTITRSTTTLPATGTKYRVVINGGVCGDATSAIVALQEALPSVAGTITTSAASVCLGGAITYNLFGYVGATIQWQSLASAAATSGTVVGSGPSYTATNVSGNVLYIRAVVTSGTCAPAITAVKTIVVNPTTVAGNITGAGTICPLGSATLKLVSNVGNTIQWKYSTDGVNYFNVPTTTVGTATAFGTTSTSGITTTYVVNNVAQSTWFKATVKSGLCNTEETAPVQVIVGASVAGNINVTSGFSNTICSGTATSLTLSGYAGTIVWQKSINSGLTWTTELGTTATLATGALANATITNSTVMYRAIVTLGTCGSLTTQYYSVTVLPAAKGGTVAVNDASAITVCSGSSKTLNVTGHVGAIQWQKSTTSATATDFVNVNGAITTPYTFDNITQNTWFRVVAKNGSCTTTANSIALAITVSTPAAVGVITAAANGLCPTNTGTTLTLSGAVGVISWMKSTDYTAVAPTWTAVTGTTTTLSTGALAVSTAFRAKLVSGLCAAFTNPIVITVTPSTAATVSATASQICSGLTSRLTVANYGSGTIQWQKATMLTGTYTNVTTGTGITAASYTTPALTATTYFRALITNNGCSSVTPGYVVKVSSLALANAITATVATSAADAICTNAPQTLTIGAGSIGDMIQWQYSSTSTTTGTWIDITNATSTTLAAQNYVPVIGTAITPTYFRFKMTNSCSNARVYSATIGVFYKNCSGPMKQVESIAKFDVIAYPNPSTATFNLSLTTTSSDKVGVMVYDMIGKLIETREVKPSEMSGLQVGERYPSGVYNVVVTQGEQTKTVRVVKK